MAPTGTPSRRSGVTRNVRPPVSRAVYERASVSGNSVSGSASRSSTWIVRRSTTARPVTESRVTGMVSPMRRAARQRPVSGHQPQDVPVQAEDDRIRGAADPRGVLGHRVHDRLEIGRRAGDHPQDLGGRRLLLQGLRQLAVPHLQLLEQPHVLDRDHRLVGEGLEELRSASPRRAGPPPGGSGSRRPALPRAGAAWPGRVRPPADRAVSGAPASPGTRSPAALSRSSTWIVRRSAPPGRPPCRAWQRSCSPTSARARQCPVPGHQSQDVPVQAEDDRIGAPQTRAAFSATVSMTGWRSVGELEITRRISAVAVCCSSASVSSRFRASQLLEQPDVLDRDHRLVGEGLQQLDLLVGERPDSRSATS